MFCYEWPENKKWKEVSDYFLAPSKNREIPDRSQYVPSCPAKNYLYSFGLGELNKY